MSARRVTPSRIFAATPRSTVTSYFVVSASPVGASCDAATAKRTAIRAPGAALLDISAPLPFMDRLRGLRYFRQVLEPRSSFPLCQGTHGPVPWMRSKKLLNLTKLPLLGETLKRLVFAKSCTLDT